MTSHRALDALVCGYAMPARARKLFVIVSVHIPSTHVAYIDESQGTAKRRLLLLSGCVLSHEQWSEFSDDWSRTLNENPPIKAFHMREARNLSGSFAGWDRSAVDHKVIALCEVILRTDMHVISCWVDESEYRDTVAATATPDLRNAYFICFQSIVVFLARAQRELGRLTPIDYVFDEKGDTGNEALLWYSAMKDSCDPEIRDLMGSTPIFRNDDEVLPLQAADLIAWRNRRRKETSSNDPEMASSMRLDELTYADIPLNRNVLDAIAEKNRRLPGVAEAKAYPSVYQQEKRAYRKEERRKKHGKDKSQ